jgi:hypothetical protein
VPGQTPLKAG